MILSKLKKNETPNVLLQEMQAYRQNNLDKYKKDPIVRFNLNLYIIAQKWNKLILQGYNDNAIYSQFLKRPIFQQNHLCALILSIVDRKKKSF